MYEPQTHIDTDGHRFLLNGGPTYRGTSVEGLLFNVRTVNATFDDTLGQVDWFDDDGARSENGRAGYGPWVSPQSAGANTVRFIEGLAQYRAHGMLAVNLNFQGGHPLKGKPWIAEGHGSAGSRPNGHRDFYHNSAFRADGDLDPQYAKRLEQAIEACDGLGMAVILQLFYFGQDTVFAGADEIRTATDSAVDFVCEKGYTNVVLEIANEVMEGHYHHAILKPGGVAELIHRARERAGDQHGRALLVGTSEAALRSQRQWTREQIDEVFAASDVVLIHGGDDVETGRVGDASELARKVDYLRGRSWYRERPRPIATNESAGEQAFAAMVRYGISFGLHSEYLQTMFPPQWGVWDNETQWFFRRVRDLTRD